MLLRSNALTTLPESLRLLTSLKTINVVRNRLEFVPDALCTLTRIVDLELSVNRCACVRWCPLFSYALRVIVIVVATCRELCCVYLCVWRPAALQMNHECRLRALPSCIGNLRNVTQLTLSENCLVDDGVPDSLAQLPLRSLNLASNALTVIPSCLCAIAASARECFVFVCCVCYLAC
jgi:hypothetical protein